MRVLFKARKVDSHLVVPLPLVIQELRRLHDSNLFSPVIEDEYLGLVIQELERFEATTLTAYKFTSVLILVMSHLEESKQRLVYTFLPAIVGTMKDMADGVYSDFFQEVRAALVKVLGYADSLPTDPE